jgi:hypothetical protein
MWWLPMTKVFPRPVGNYNDWIQGDIEALNVYKSYLTYNAPACLFFEVKDKDFLQENS